MYARIVADSREREGANPYLEAAVAENNRRCARRAPSKGGNPLEYLIQTITVGDYAITLSGRPGEPGIPALIIERKTWKDLAASIKDSRAKTQHARMTQFQQSTHCRFVYLIEGVAFHKGTMLINGVPCENLAAKLRHNLLRGMGWLHSRDAVHSAEVITQLARDVVTLACEGDILIPGLHAAERLEAQYQRELEHLHRRYGRAADGSLAELAGVIQPMEEELPAVAEEDVVGESSETLEDRLDHGDKIVLPEMLVRRETATDADVLEKMWAAFPGVGAKMAAALRVQQQLCLRSLLMAGPEEIEGAVMKLAQVPTATGSKLGRQKALVIVGSLQSSGDVTSEAAVATVSRHILEAIPRISGSTAQLILNQYTLKQICVGEVGERHIAEVRRAGTGNRRLGVSIGEQVCRYLRQVAG
jgi:ERCC4-type nuclease